MWCGRTWQKIRTQLPTQGRNFKAMILRITTLFNDMIQWLRSLWDVFFKTNCEWLFSFEFKVQNEQSNNSKVWLFVVGFLLNQNDNWRWMKPTSQRPTWQPLNPPFSLQKLGLSALFSWAHEIREPRLVLVVHIGWFNLKCIILHSITYNAYYVYCMYIVCLDYLYIVYMFIVFIYIVCKCMYYI